jgi:hypothetical protein
VILVTLARLPLAFLESLMFSGRVNDSTGTTVRKRRPFVEGEVT